ncbi:hypothetical protein [Filibacter tadaridae]|uniref:hypothetical protein n=1 Tax=Filibacter tadaridae TaxID=2483811 RepID=UPI0039EC1223
MECRAATPAGTARAEGPGLSVAREAAEAVPAESVRSERKPAGSRITLSNIFIKNDVNEDPPHLLFKGMGIFFHQRHLLYNRKATASFGVIKVVLYRYG